MSYTRRDLLKTSLGASALWSLSSSVPLLLRRAALAAPALATDQRVLVVLQLTGGNDGLNTLVPFDHDVYARSRTTLRLTGRQVLRINDRLGFHPKMQGFERLYKDGHLAVVQSVGYPDNDRSHDTALHHWHTARPAARGVQTGWVGRAIDHAAARDESAAAPGVFVGPIARPFAMNAARTVVPAVHDARQLRLHHRAAADPLSRPVAGVNPMLEFVSRGMIDAAAQQRRLAALADHPSPADYPPYQIADDLRTVADLIRADLGVRIFYVELGGGGIGGFDNHASQRDNHAALLQQLAGSVAGFVDDLRRDRLLDRVLLMTMSEFGRTVGENGRRGTGHGAAAPMFLAGGGVRAGLIGPAMDLDDLVADAPRHHVDFRAVYATALSQWLGFDAAAILGETHDPVPMLG